MAELFDLLKKLWELIIDMKEIGEALAFLAKVTLNALYALGKGIKFFSPIYMHLPIQLVMPFVAILCVLLYLLLKKILHILMIITGGFLYFRMSIDVVRYFGLGIALAGIFILVWPKYEGQIKSSFKKLKLKEKRK